MANYTPGPWVVNDEDYYNSEPYAITIKTDQGDDSRLLATVRDYGTEQIGYANAHLMAKAPKLLEALEALVNAKTLAENDECYALNEGIHLAEIDHAVALAKAAIAKAKGE
jgi:hypothetical protein